MADPHRPDPVDGDPLAAELRRLGRAVDVPPPPPDLAAAILTRIPPRPPPPSAARRFAAAASGWATRGRRIAVAVLLAVVLAVAAGTPAAARIAQWLGLGGVVVVQTPGGAAPAPGPAPGAAPALTLDEAAERAGFAPAVPSALGAPDRVSVSDDGVVVSMQWAPTAPGAPALRLDQFVGGPAPTFAKRYHDIVEFVAVDGAEALWLAHPHTLEYLDATGRQRIQPSRTSGPGLIWQRGEVTLRLEGEPDRDRALAIAGSVR
ncbi:hypothetical protein [Pseudonocardia humida]|uniref:DUF4367 domain-containing protein n=1 Tax=Pseudonocardia humida TaxID=2800819 RepID=A0ABT0ZRW0_9PSEU|nr:hypothetical protein [Pseudonocardia humida]MCO1653447.1 hypothetical protein [Pseudonocardia humida]